jgi:hypothetical protein
LNFFVFILHLNYLNNIKFWLYICSFIGFVIISGFLNEILNSRIYIRRSYNILYHQPFVNKNHRQAFRFKRNYMHFRIQHEKLVLPMRSRNILNSNWSRTHWFKNSHGSRDFDENVFSQHFEPRFGKLRAKFRDCEYDFRNQRKKLRRGWIFTFFALHCYIPRNISRFKIFWTGYATP